MYVHVIEIIRTASNYCVDDNICDLIFIMTSSTYNICKQKILGIFALISMYIYEVFFLGINLLCRCLFNLTVCYRRNRF